MIHYETKLVETGWLLQIVNRTNVLTYVPEWIDHYCFMK